MTSGPGTTADYSRRFFAGQRGGSDRSAQRVVGLVMDLIAPTSVVDVGCGVGAWLAAFQAAGVEDVVGVDGDYVPTDMLQVDRSRFIPANLQKPLDIRRTFDLAMSLEVAEHLPDTVADDFVATLCGLAPVVLFSAATPLQGGTGHVNERPQSYWAERFARHGFRAVDALRPEIWNDPDVKFWYRQNAMVYASERALQANGRLREIAARTDERMLDIVHPELLGHRNARPEITMRSFLPQWTRRKAAAVKRAVRGQRGKA
ncbi:MAG: class I SAM-dependent methyltransferase [Phycisphaerales bacterium]